jgi:hypothetical protein
MLDEAIFETNTAAPKSDKHKPTKDTSRDGLLDIRLTPVFELTDKPELMELTLEEGMAVQIL